MSHRNTAATEQLIVTAGGIPHANGATDLAGTLRTIVDRQEAKMAFQPVVDLDSGAVFGFEALARGAPGEDDVRPDLLFDQARRAGVAGELDWICRTSAVDAFLRSDLDRDLLLLINAEPLSLSQACPPTLAHRWDEGVRDLRLILEITEREVADHPGQLLEGVRRVRSAGIGVALDDVGTEPASLALMSLLRPDLIKLDMSVIRKRFTFATVDVCDAVAAEAERHGTLVVAEGIGGPDQEQVARAVGARAGQGWLYAKPGPLPTSMAPAPPITCPSGTVPDVSASPFAARGDGRTRPMTAAQLATVLTHAEYRSIDFREPTLLLRCFGGSRNFGPTARRRYDRLGAQGMIAVAFGSDLPPQSGVRSVAVAPDDPIAGEQCVVVLSPNFASAVLAREQDRQRHYVVMYDVFTSHQREIVADAARSLLSRVPDLPPIP